MKFTKLELRDAFLVELEKRGDDRGFFARLWCQNEFEEHGLVPVIAQANISNTKIKGTIRGLHFQVEPHAETKYVRCVKGALFDVIIDIQPDSPTFMKSYSVILTADNYKMLYVPKGFAHGFQSLEPDTEMTYLVSEFYAPQAEGGIRYNDPAFKIQWPLPVSEISDKDRNWPDFKVEDVT